MLLTRHSVCEEPINLLPIDHGRHVQCGSEGCTKGHLAFDFEGWCIKCEVKVSITHVL